MRTVRSLVAIAILGLATFAGTPTAHAGLVTNAKIIQITVEGTNHVTVKFNLNIVSKASCATVVNTMAFDASTAKGKAMLSVANAAFLGSIAVAAIGTTATTAAGCTTVSGVSYETLATLAMAQ